MKKKINIGIAEDHALVRQGFVSILNAYSDIKIVFEARDGAELIRHLKEFKPDIILLDISMPEVDGVQVLKIMGEHFPEIRIIMISGYSDEMFVTECVSLGANAYLDKTCTADTLVQTIYGVYKHRNYFNSETTRVLKAHGVLPIEIKTDRQLTEKEIVMLKLICSGKEYNKIADLTGVSERTVRWYEHQLFQKTNCKSLDDLKTYAKKNQFILE